MRQNMKQLMNETPFTFTEIPVFLASPVLVSLPSHSCIAFISYYSHAESRFAEMRRFIISCYSISFHSRPADNGSSANFQRHCAAYGGGLRFERR